MSGPNNGNATERLLSATEQYIENTKASNNALLDIIQNQDNFLQMLLALTDDGATRAMIEAQRTITDNLLAFEAARFSANSIHPDTAHS